MNNLISNFKNKNIEKIDKNKEKKENYILGEIIINDKDKFKKIRIINSYNK